MARKFRDDQPSGEYSTGPSLAMTLTEYVAKYAPDILQSIPQMNGTPALDFYVETFEPAKKHEGKELVKNSIKWPYAQRIVNLARRFLSLDGGDRRFVMQAAKEKVWWRGDDLDFFDTVITETMGYRNLTPGQKEKYKKRIWDMANSLRGRHEKIEQAAG